MAAIYSLRVDTVEGFSWTPGTVAGRKLKPNLYVVIRCNGIEVDRTPTKLGFDPQWKHLYEIPSDYESSNYSLRVFHHGPLISAALGERDRCLGSVDTNVAALLDYSENFNGEAVRLPLTPWTGVEEKLKGHSIGTLLVHLMRKGTILPLQRAQRQSGLSRPSQEAGPSAKYHVHYGPLNEAGSALGVLISKLEILVLLEDKLPKIHLHVHIAWNIFMSVLKALQKQKEQNINKKLLNLIDTMGSMYSFADDIDLFADEIKSLEDKVFVVVKQTVECALFIEEYIVHGFRSHPARDFMSGTIDHFVEVFRQLNASFDANFAGDEFFFWAETQELPPASSANSNTIKQLNPMEMNDAFRPECCLPGTGREILDEVTGWLAVPSDSFGKILLLSGVAGSGKSSIAATISLAFLEIRRLGAFLFFNRNDPARSHPDLVIRRLAHLLARHNTHFETAIAAAIEGNPNVMTTPLQHQFKTLILGPALSVERHIRGPIFIVIDALDECGNPDSRAALLSVVAEDFPQLPDLFRFLITTRPEADIVDHQGCKLFPMKSLDPGTDSSLADVQLFIRHELARIGQQRKLAPAWPKKEHLHTLVNLAGGRFLWAAMAIRLIDAFRPNEQLQSLIAQKSTRELDIDALYTTALESVVYWSNRETAHEARAVLACVALAREPVLDLTIARLTRGGSAAKLVYSLRSVIQIHPRADARQVYPGVVEFLTNPSRSGGKHWAIDVRIEQQSLALGCLEILNSELQFNICGLEDSHILNTAIADSAHRIASRISPPLSYASRFWFNHLQEAAFDPEVVQAMDIFFREKFLYWLEVLSLMGQVAIVPTALTAADSYVKKVDGDLKDFIGDARRFVATFKFVIMQSAPHIYLSALPFVPRESRVAQQFNPCFPKTLRVASSGIQWPSTEKSSLGHKDWVHSVCFSPDGRRIISGADDKIVCVWDAKTGDLVAGPCSGHTGDVNSVAYSPDGTRIASGATDCTIRIWDPSTGEALGKPFEGHEGEVNSVSFSPDGTRVVSGAADATIFMWDVATGEIVGESLEGHTGQVMSVSFSPDGTRIVSGAADGTVRLWDVATGKAVGKPIEDSTFAVTSVNYSSDGTRIVSACTNNTIRMFDAETGAMIGEPFEEDSYSVSFSPDGTRIACGSRSIFVLDAETGFRVAGPLDGHTSHIYCVNFAPDGMRIASASADQTVRVTDLSGFRLVPGQDLPAENAQKSSSLGKPLGDFPRLNSLTGWIHNASGELMFWVPYWLRDGLYFPHHTLVISIEPHTKLDLSAFVHGTEWTQCIDPEFRDRVRFIVDRAAQKVQS